MKDLNLMSPNASINITSLLAAVTEALAVGQLIRDTLETTQPHIWATDPEAIEALQTRDADLIRLLKQWLAHQQNIQRQWQACLNTLPAETQLKVPSLSSLATLLASPELAEKAQRLKAMAQLIQGLANDQQPLLAMGLYWAKQSLDALGVDAQQAAQSYNAKGQTLESGRAQGHAQTAPVSDVPIQPYSTQSYTA